MSLKRPRRRKRPDMPAPLYHTVLGDIPNGYGIIAVFPTYEEAWRFIRNDPRVLHMGVPYSMDELFSRVIDPELLASLSQRKVA